MDVLDEYSEGADTNRQQAGPQEFPSVCIDRFTPAYQKLQYKHYFLSHAHTDHFWGLLHKPSRNFPYMVPSSFITYLKGRTGSNAATLHMHQHTYAALKLYIETASIWTPDEKMRKLSRLEGLKQGGRIQLRRVKVEYSLQSNGTLQMTLFGAGHSPGSVMLVLENGTRHMVLYTGDCRLTTRDTKNMITHLTQRPKSVGHTFKFTRVYLDTTFIDTETTNRYQNFDERLVVARAYRDRYCSEQNRLIRMAGFVTHVGFLKELLSPSSGLRLHCSPEFRQFMLTLLDPTEVAEIDNRLIARSVAPSDRMFHLEGSRDHGGCFGPNCQAKNLQTDFLQAVAGQHKAQATHLSVGETVRLLRQLGYTQEDLRVKKVIPLCYRRKLDGTLPGPEEIIAVLSRHLVNAILWAEDQAFPQIESHMFDFTNTARD